MARGIKSDISRRADQRAKLHPTLPKSLLSLMEDEAALCGLSDVGEFLSAVIESVHGSRSFARAHVAPPRKPLAPRRLRSRKQLHLNVTPLARRLVYELVNRLGSTSISIVCAHSVLAWCGISPLAPGPVSWFVARPPKRSAVGRAKTVRWNLVLAEPIWDLVDVERHDRSRAEYIREVVRWKLGMSAFIQPARRTRARLLPNREHTKTARQTALPLEVARGFSEIQARLGGEDKNSVLSALVLEFLGLSPFVRPLPHASRRM